MKILKAIGSFLLYILAIFVLLLLLVGFVLYLLLLPVHLLCYYTSPYYRKEKQGFRLFIGEREDIRLYNRLARAHHPFAYFQSKAFTCFVIRECVYVFGWGYDTLLQRQTGEWYFEVTGEKGETEELDAEEVLDRARASLSEKYRALPIKFLHIGTCASNEGISMCPLFERFAGYSELSAQKFTEN